MIKKGWLLFLAVVLTAGFAGTSYAASVDLSGQVRVRAEYRENFDFDSSPNAVDENAWVEQRTRLTANATVSDDVSAKITLQDTRNWGQEGSTANTAAGPEATDLHEGYLQVGNLLGSDLALKMGRQKIAKGDQRILGGLEWSSNARAFDGIALVHSSDQATVTAAWVKVFESQWFGPGGSDQDTDLWVAYAEIKAIPNNQIDVYAILARDGDVGGAQLADSLYTIGARLAGNVENVGVDYTVEIPFQFGDTGTQEGSPTATDGSFGGYAIFVKGGYTVPGENKIRLGAEYNIGSGDDNGADSDEETFIDMKLGTNHMHYGYMDINGNTVSNRTHWNVNAKANVTPELNLYAAYWGHKITESGTSDDDLGSEINLQAKYNLAAGTTLVVGYGHATPGGQQDALAVLAGRSGADAQDWAFMMFNTNF